MNGIFLHLIGMLLGICQQAAATLPIITILTLIAGRRGQSQFYLAGSRALLKFAFLLAFLGIFHFPFAYLGELFSFGEQASNLWAPFFALPGLPWSMSMLAQISGVVSLAVSFAVMPLHRPRTYNFASFKISVSFVLLAAFFFASTFFLINWPFAGYPQGLSGARVFQAVFRNALSHYFTAFCPAGALCLLITAYKPMLSREVFMKSERALACRWFALWAFIGYVPYLVQSWAILIGVSARGNIAGLNPNYLGFHVLALSLLSLGESLWLFQLLSKRVWRWAAVTAFGLFLGFCWIP